MMQADQDKQVIAERPHEIRGTRLGRRTRSTIFRTVRQSLVAVAVAVAVVAMAMAGSVRADTLTGSDAVSARPEPVAFIVPNHWRYPGQFIEEAAPASRRAPVSRDPHGRVLRGGEAGPTSGLAGPGAADDGAASIGFVAALFLAMVATVATMWRRLARSVAPARRSWEEWT